MTRDLISVGPDILLEDLAETLEKHRIKRVPVLRNGQLIGIVSRADLLRGLVAFRAASRTSADDETIKTAVESALLDAAVRHEFLSVVVSGGVVHLWGAVESDAEKKAAGVAAEGVPGVKSVHDQIGVLPASVRSVIWAE